MSYNSKKVSNIKNKVTKFQGCWWFRKIIFNESKKRIIFEPSILIRVRLSVLGYKKYQKNLKILLKCNQLPSIPSRKKALSIVVINYRKEDIKVQRSYPVFLNFFTSFMSEIVATQIIAKVFRISFVSVAVHFRKRFYTCK